MDKAEARLGKMEIMINNAGIFNEVHFEKQIAINLVNITFLYMENISGFKHNFTRHCVLDRSCILWKT